MNVLIVDDSRVIRNMIARIMRTFGYETHEAGNGIEGLDQLAKLGEMDLILVDWNMPEMDGLEFIKAVRADADHAHTPMIMVTTESEMDRMALAFMAGVNEYIMKPFTEENIGSKLEILGIGTAV
ncbi:response regulator [Rhodopirellula sallentina]|uniref:Response regulator receiver protein n=1 Tax=Rhodopirellula sallentina SM41 TaxID=1263870 RepID=M5U5Q4_9BACT|nr:response regulator [Rhodopirellula sallentina]EMI56782.1 response regulator receiver protein [Rhodopirellula sallentina SM41]